MWPFNSKAEDYSTRRKNERDLKLDYFSHVVADSHRLPGAARALLTAALPTNLGRILTDFDRTGQVSPGDEAQLDWGEIATLEDKILGLDDDVGVRRRAWQIRSRYARLVGPERYQAYLSSNPPSDQDPALPMLRGDLRRLLAATHFTYSLALVRENVRRRVLQRLLTLALVLCLATFAFGGWRLGADWQLLGLLSIVAAFGSLGAYVSTQRRLQNATDGGDPVIGVLALHEFNAVVLFPLVAGGIFAVVLYFIIASGFMTGELFPASPTPGNLQDWAKLLLWSFVAGFAERLVPDTLDRLVNQSAQSSSIPAAPMAPPPPAAPAPAPASLATPAPPANGPASTDVAKDLADFRAKAPTPPPVESEEN